jgi:hypothetical protein
MLCFNSVTVLCALHLLYHYNIYQLPYPFLHVQSVHFAGLLDVLNILSSDTGIFQQTKGHSFGDHLISWSVNATSSSVIEASNVLCSVSLYLV